MGSRFGLILKKALPMAAFLAVLIGCGHIEIVSISSAERGGHEDSPVRRTERVTAYRLNLRQQPSNDTAVVSVLRKYTQVEILRKRGNWIEVRTLDGRTGWVDARYLTGFGWEYTEPSGDVKADVPQTPEVPEKDKSQKAVSPEVRAEGGQQLFAHSQGYCKFIYPTAWTVVKDTESGFERVLFQSPSGKAEAWVLSAPAGDLTLDQFYIQLASPLKQRYGSQAQITPPFRSLEADVEWLNFKVVVTSGEEEIYRYAVARRYDRLWAIVLLSRRGLAGQERRELDLIRSSFAFKHPEEGTPRVD
jgi:SH3-like domain-containing protein